MADQDPFFLPDVPDAVADDGPSDRSRLLLITGLVGGGVLAFLVCAGLLAFVFVQVAQDFGGTAAPVELQSPEEKQAELVAAFGSETIGVDEAELPAIRRLFDQMVRATSEHDTAAYLRLFDLDRLLQEMKAQAGIRRMLPWDEALARQWLRETLAIPFQWQRYHLAHVRPAPGGNEATVYGYFWDETNAIEVRWWITRHDGRWKVYDWENLQFGLRESAEFAIYYQADEDFRMDEHRRIDADIVASDQLRAEGEDEQARQKLRQAEGWKPLPALADERTLAIAYAWSRSGRYHECLALCRRIRSPDAIPGAWYVQALCSHYLDRPRKTLEFIEPYDALIGGGPNVSELKAQALMDLGRPAEAVAEWRKLLRIDPQRTDVLEQFGRALGEQEKDVLADYVLKLDDPAEAAESLASDFAYYGESAAADAMVRLLQTLAPDSARVEAALGTLCRADERYDEAAVHFRNAFTRETDEELRQRYVYRFLDAMYEADQVVEAYEAAPDPADAFEYLADYFDEDESESSLEILGRLIEAHRRRQPDDLWLHFYSGVLLAAQDRHEEAEQAFAAGMAATDDEEMLWSFRERRLAVLYKLAGAVEAYRTLGPDTFISLANRAYWDEDGESLRQLVAAHRTEHPDDEWLDYHAARAHQLDKNYPEADLLLVRGYARTTDESIRESYRSQWLFVRRDWGRLLDALRDIPPADETFTFVAWHCYHQENWDELQRLIERHRLRNGESVQTMAWTVELNWKTENYEEVVRRLTSRSEFLEHNPDTTEFPLGERLVRSYLRLNRPADAMAAARKIFEKHAEPLPMVLVHAHQRDPDGVLRCMDEYGGGRFSRMQLSLYDDPDIGEILHSPEFLEVRWQFPPARPYSVGGSSIVLLLKEPVLPDGERIAAEAAAVLGSRPAVTQLSAAQSDPTHSFVLEADGSRFMIVVGSDCYDPDSTIDEDAPLEDDQLRQAVADHAGWLEIILLEPTPADSDDELRSVRCLARQFADDNCLAILADGMRLLPNQDAIRTRLAADPPDRQLGEVGEYFRLHRTTEETDAEVLKERRRRLKRLPSAFAARQPEQEFQIQIEVRAGSFVERPWLVVEQALPQRYGRPSFVGRFVADSLLSPRLSAGEPLRVEWYEVIDWKQ